MRVTRARAQQKTEEPTDAERGALTEISPNASPQQAATEVEVPKKTPARSKSKKGAKKGAKGRKTKPVDEEGEQRDADSPADTGDVVAEDLQDTVDDVAAGPAVEERPVTPPAKAVRLTRRQLAKQEEESKQTQRAQTPIEQPEPASEDSVQVPPEQAHEETAVPEETLKTSAGVEAEIRQEIQPQHPAEPQPVVEQATIELEAEDIIAGAQESPIPHNEEPASIQPTLVAAEPQFDAAESEISAPTVEILPEHEPKTLATERPSEGALTPVSSRTPSRRRASRSPSKSPMRIEESLEAIDALEEALENVGKAVSHFDQSNDEKSPQKKAFPKDVATPGTRSKTPARTPAKPTTAAKTPLAQRVSRTPSAAPTSAKPTKSSLARASSVRLALPKETRKPSADTGDYLASKRRPISVSFPTPPPPPKGRAPTKPSFQLSSDNVAAKLKAQKEERLKRESEREAEGTAPKQRPVSVNLAPTAKSTKPITKANFQLPGEAVAAKLKAQREERLKRDAEGAHATQSKPKARPISMPPPPKSTKPPTKANFQLPGEAIAAKLKAQREERQKREEEAEAAKKAAVTASKSRTTSIRKPIALPTRTISGPTIPPPPAPKPEPNKRNSIQLSRSASVSTSTSQTSQLIAKSTVTPVDAAHQKLKGREVFLRYEQEKDIKEKERREKEEAAKKARADAAERGRIASREWAEKQRKKMMDAVRLKAGGAGGAGAV